MGIEETHEDQEPRVGGADHADPAVGLRHVLHQPVDRVPGVGRVVDGGRVQRPAQRAVHHVLALRAVFAADVLKDPDVAREGHDVVGRRDHRLQPGARRAGGGLVGVVGRAGEQDRHLAGAARAARRLRDQDHRVELHAVAHRDLDLAPVVVEAPVRDLEFRRDIAPRRHRQLLRGLGRGAGAGGSDSSQQDQKYSSGPAGKSQGSEVSHRRLLIV